MELEGLVSVKMSDTPFLEQPLLFMRLPVIKGWGWGEGVEGSNYISWELLSHTLIWKLTIFCTTNFFTA